MRKRHTRIALWLMTLLALCNGVITCAAEEPTAMEALMQGGVSIFSLIGTVAKLVGYIVILVGLVKYVMAYQSADGPEYQKSVMMIVSGAGVEMVVSVIKELLLTVKDRQAYVPNEGNIKAALHHMGSSLCAMTGGILLVTGLVRFVFAHSNDDGGSQQKAVMMIAISIALLVVASALKL